MDPAYKLTTIDSVTVNGSPAVGIQIQHNKGDEFKLYFGSRTTHLTKVELTVASCQEVNKTTLLETIYTD